MLGIFWALHACAEVRTYGFGGGSTRARSVTKAGAGAGYTFLPRSRYYAQAERKNPYGDLDHAHDWELENLVHNKLEEAGALERRFQPFMSHLRHETHDQSSPPTWVDPYEQARPEDRGV